jgi:transposase
MGSIVHKVVNGQTYYYLREMARVDGKPKMISQRYLGKAADIEAAMDGAMGVPQRTRHLGFGDVAAVWSMLVRLDVAGIIDDVVGARRAGASGSVGTYICLATVNRVVAPCSKLGFADWWATTAGDRWVRMPAAALDHRRFWAAMDSIDADMLIEIERRIGAVMVAEFGLDLSALVLDMTNFATYIDTGNTRAPIAQRGRAKQKRSDLRLVGLGLVVTRDGGIPLCSHAYAGDRPDVTQFAGMVTELVERWGTLAADTNDVTLVYDAGQDSVTNQAHIDNSPLHFVGSLPPSDHRDLLAVSARRYRPVDQDRYPGVTAFDTRGTALGADRRLIVTHSPTLHAKQLRGFAQTTANVERRLSELAARLARGRTRKPLTAVQADIATICKPRWINRVITWHLTGDSPKEFRLDWTLDKQGVNTLATELFGKRILFTDRDDWPVADVITAYRSQSVVENDFRQMKDPHIVSFSPMHHWTEQKIRVHTFYCVLALAIARLMARHTGQAGTSMSVHELLTTLAGIQETVLLYPSTGGRPKARRLTTDLTPKQHALYDLFNLADYAPKH